jgi:multiple sugar transport system substrate-binding protein
MVMKQAERTELSRRAFLQAVGLAGGASMLAACTPAAALAAETAGAQVVNFLWTDAQNKRQPLIKDFEEATGIQVNQTQVAYNDLFNKITTSVQGGADVDVIEMDTIWTAQFASAGWVQDISDQVTEAITADVPESALSAVRFGGKLYGIPWFNSAKHLFYNQKLLQEAGFDQPPATLDEFVEQAKATTREGQWGSTWCWKQGEGLICDWVAIMFANQGAQLLDDSGKAVFNDMGGTDALQWMVDMLYTHKAADPASLENTENDVLRALETGKYALTYNWEGTLPQANDPAKSQAAPHVRIGLLPGSQDVKSSSVNGSEGWAILTGARHKANAWKLLEYMISPAWQKKAALTIGDYPVLSSLYSDPDLLQHVEDFPLYGEQFKYLAARPQVPGYAQKSDIIQRYLQEALLQKMSPQEAMDAAVNQVNQAGRTP